MVKYFVVFVKVYLVMSKVHNKSVGSICISDHFDILKKSYDFFIDLNKLRNFAFAYFCI